MKGKRILRCGLLATLLLALGVGLVLAQDPEGSTSAQRDAVAAAALGDGIAIQGRLLDSSGNPINGTRTVTLALYDAATSGNALCSDTENVTVANGLFTAYLNGCTADDLNGRQVWLGVRVGGDAEMTPRQPIYAVPYAWSLRPGAQISYTPTTWVGTLVDLEGNLGDGITWKLGHSYALVPGGRANVGVRAEASGGNRAYGVHGQADAGTSGVAYGLYGRADATGSGSEAYGVYGTTDSANGWAGYFASRSGKGVYAESEGSVAIKAGGSGIIQSTAATDWVVSPLKIVQEDSVNNGDLRIIPSTQFGYVKLYTAGKDDCKAVLPVDVVAYLFGSRVKLSKFHFCYRMDNVADKITQVDVLYIGDDGQAYSLCSFPDDVSSTTWACADCMAGAGSPIMGSVFVRFSFHFAEDGADRGIRLGTMYLHLVE